MGSVALSGVPLSLALRDDVLFAAGDVPKSVASAVIKATRGMVATIDVSDAGNPAILVYANKVQRSDGIDTAFATVFPSMTILKILCAQIAAGSPTP